ncbi:glycosyltransferase [Labedella endophytica]|uniref:D-inositol 3-phosphate glycosyltransferase n=1 Tax=Labedella endophytica TaxID=1523160 RepID=A0A433JTI8_9MICO|nr:glycosyltransferase [Labedella endophytica]RUR01643.1 glycosyltransferase [Labedella endophytica]
MHILIVSDQHAESAGGVQVSIRLQTKFLERAGHAVTVCAPRMHAPHRLDPHDVDTRSIPITLDREYSASLPGRWSDAALDRAMASRAPVDVVHVQADFWQAAIGYRFAERHGLPVVHTFHNHMEFGIEQVVPFPRLAVRAMVWAQGLVLKPRRSSLPTSAWRFLDELAKRASALVAPSSHFASLLESKGVGTAIDVIPTGVDDDLVEEVRGESTIDADVVPAGERRPVFLWIGRMSAEKRLMEFLEAVRLSGADAEFRLYGAGLLLSKARAFVERHGLGDRVVFAGRVPYRESLRAMGAADALVQTSIGFETQGMTVFEATVMGTRSIVSDPAVAGELPAGSHWQPRDGSIAALAETLAEVSTAIRTGTLRPMPGNTGDGLRQSAQTERMIAVYERVLRTS